jgi:hypothetical protein
MPRRERTPGEFAVCWIEQYCAAPGGRPVELTVAERETIYHLYDNPAPVAGRLFEFLTLVHLCSKLAVPGQAPPAFGPVNFFRLWNAASPELREFLRCEGEAVVCPGLNTRWRPAA